MSSLLTNKIISARRRHVAVSWLTGVGAAVLFVAATAGLALWLDWAIELPWVVRFTLLIVYVSGALAAVWWLALRPIVRGPDDEEIALAVERYEPGFATRLIAAVQFSRLDALPAGMNVGMIRALIGQAEELAKPVEFANVFPAQRMWQLTAGAVGAVVVVLTCLGMAGPTGAVLLQRAALMNVPLPRATTVEVLGGDRVVARGDALTISALACGVVPDAGSVRMRFASGSVQRFELHRSTEESAAGRFDLTLDSVLEPFDFDVYLNDGHADRPYKVSVVDRPAVASLAIRQIYPAYTKLGTVRKQPADLTLLAGSALEFNVTSTSPVSRRAMNGKISRVTLHGAESKQTPSTRPAGVEPTVDLPLDVDAADARKLTTGKPISIPGGTAGLTLHLVDESGVESKDPAFYHVTLVDDKAPAVTIKSPAEREETVTRRAFVPVSFVATDDFALARLSVHYRVVQKSADADSAAAGENAVAATVVERPDTKVELDLGDNPAAVRGVYRLQVAKLLPLPIEGDLIEWWLEAVDGNNATGPGKATTDVYRARVVSEIDKRSELLTKFGDASSTFNDLAETQQTVNEKLGGAILNKEPPP